MTPKNLDFPLISLQSVAEPNVQKPCNTRTIALLAGFRKEVVPGVGVEPTRGKSPRDFKSRTSAIPSARHSGSYADINIFARSDKGAAAWSVAAFFSLHSAD